MCIHWTRDKYSVVITLYINPPEFHNVNFWSMLPCNTNSLYSKQYCGVLNKSDLDPDSVKALWTRCRSCLYEISC